MKHLSIVILCLLSLFSQAQPITGTFGSPNTGTGIRGALYIDSMLYIPPPVFRIPSIPGALRYDAIDSSLYIWTGFAWRKANIENFVTHNLSATANRSHSFGNNTLTLGSISTYTVNSSLGAGIRRTQYIQTANIASLKSFTSATDNGGLEIGNNPIYVKLGANTTGLSSNTEYWPDSMKINSNAINIPTLRAPLFSDTSRYATMVWDKTTKGWYRWFGFAGGSSANFANTNLTATGDRVHDFTARTLAINGFYGLNFNSFTGSGLQSQLTMDPLSISFYSTQSGGSAGINFNHITGAFGRIITGSSNMQFRPDSLVISYGRINIPVLRTMDLSDTSRYVSVVWDKHRKGLYGTFGFPGSGSGGGGESDPIFLASEAASITLSDKINWTSAYSNMITSLGVTGTTLKTITLNQQDGGTVSGDFTDNNTTYSGTDFIQNQFAVDQTADLRISGSGKFTNLYSSIFQVQKDIAATWPLDISSTDGGWVRIGGAASIGFAPAMQFRPDLTNQNATYLLFQSGNSGAVPAAVFSAQATNGAALGTQDLFTFRNAGTDRFKILNNGTLQVSTLDTDVAPPSTSGTTRTLVADASGNISSIPNVSSFTINNNADNRLLTATGVAGEANAEVNLTFSGSALSVSGDLAVSNMTTTANIAGGVDAATDADKTILYFYTTLPDITANRTITLPTGAGNIGRVIILRNNNTSGTFSWNLNANIKTSAGGLTSTLLNNTTYQIIYEGGTDYQQIN